MGKDYSIFETDQEKKVRSFLKRIQFYITILILLLAGVAFHTQQMIYDPRTYTDDPIPVYIREGESIREVAQNLEEKGVVKSSFWFMFYQKIWGKPGRIKAGYYEIPSSLNIIEISQLLISGVTSDRRITFPEGWSVKQYADRLSEAGMVDKDDFYKKAIEYEGYLFPDTYNLPLKSTEEEIITRLKNNFQSRTADLLPTKDQVIIASIVEREAKLDEDRAKIAGIYYNRLAIGMKLEADPTVQYGKGDWKQITLKDYRSVDSPYNTYLYKGLPPAPICNPGLKSIQAAVNPEEHNYYFFFNLEDGTTIYSRTLEEHNQNKVKYGLGR